MDEIYTSRRNRQMRNFHIEFGVRGIMNSPTNNEGSNLATDQDDGCRRDPKNLLAMSLKAWSSPQHQVPQLQLQLQHLQQQKQLQGIQAANRRATYRFNLKVAPSYGHVLNCDISLPDAPKNLIAIFSMVQLCSPVPPEVAPRVWISSNNVKLIQNNKQSSRVKLIANHRCNKGQE
ncbi:hypothetical protein CAPTEDRAFT_212921 [Capitella teleta]|uniref:Uncharacterized protein n=1 Tax=Capitella teleta TaxID=283909 RepID=R7TPE9_CAPTE|nr:hypothetical protein CAPTEDRAFT_212921 [Capitella teleta]|eukprot:ELT93376.1 hypothetical protein CAPTEDRAFT_212921 [Capitella teleta]